MFPPSRFKLRKLLIATAVCSLGASQMANAQLLGFIGIGNNGQGDVLIDLPALLSPITEPLGDSLTPLIDTLDTTLDPVTNTIDQQLAQPLLGALSPLTSPLLTELDPIVAPVDGIVEDLTGGSLRDALTNEDMFNPGDGDGLVNDLLGADENPNSGTEAGELSPLPAITGPLGKALTPLIDTLDSTLDPLTDTLDDTLLEPVLDGLNPVTEPLLDVLEPVTDPVDGLVSDLTGGSLEDALTNNGDNPGDGNGVVNDLLGGPQDPNSGTEAGEASPLPLATSPLGKALTPLVDALDEALNPLTDAVDDTLLEPLLDGLNPITEPLLDTLAPVTDPVDGLLAEVTGGSLEDALTNNDDNTSDGNGVINDLLGGPEDPNSGTEAGEASPLPLTAGLGEALDPLLETVDTLLDPLTNVIDNQVAEPLLGALSPVLDPVTDLLEPVTDPVDGLIGDVTGGSLEDALTNNDDNTADGNGLLNDTLGGNIDAIDNGNDLNGNNNPALIGLVDADSLNGGQCADADADGVCDSRDKCADTPAGAAVLPNGCHLDDLQPLRLEGVFFEFDKAVLTPESVATLDAAIKVIQASGADRLEVAGHTDSKGSDEYNMDLSHRRAAAVQLYFIEHGIESERLQARGYGESQPTSDNDSDEGRAQNRRVELKVLN